MSESILTSHIQGLESRGLWPPVLVIPRHRSHVRIDLVLVHSQYSLTCLFAEKKRIYCPGPPR